MFKVKQGDDMVTMSPKTYLEHSLNRLFVKELLEDSLIEKAKALMDHFLIFLKQGDLVETFETKDKLSFVSFSKKNDYTIEKLMMTAFYLGWYYGKHDK